MDGDVLKRAALAFQTLTNIEYHVVLGRKMRTQKLVLRFLPDSFYHLAGLHKLKSSYPFRQWPHKKVYQQILMDKISFQTLSSDPAAPQLLSRITALTEMEHILDDDEATFFQYERRKTVINSRIDADYVVKGKINNRDIVFTFFLRGENDFFVNSVFPMCHYDYTLGQTRYAVLFKEKYNKLSGETVVLFHHRHYPMTQDELK